MRKKSIIYGTSLFFLMVFLLSTTSLANSPSSMTLEYDNDTEVLTVSITHTVSNPATHFIESVTIEVNSVIIDTFLYTSQPTSSLFTYVYNNISANFGDTIEVSAICNLVGSITRSIQVGSVEPAIPGFFGIIAILFISVILLIRFNNKKFRKYK
jgi:hypothetical protein